MTTLLSKKSQHLENQIENFLDTISEASIVFKKGVSDYMNNNQTDFIQRITDASALEAKADEIRRNVERELYTNMLIPESRGDVLAILENTDDIIDEIKKSLVEFSVERPDIPAKFHPQFISLADAGSEAVDALIKGIRTFFRDYRRVNNYLHKVHFYEKEADRIAANLKREIFSDNIDLSRKMHLRFFTIHVEKISDLSESVADRLAIFTIKREF